MQDGPHLNSLQELAERVTARFTQRFEARAIGMLVLVAFLSVLLVSTIRFTSFKSVGAGRRLSPRHVIFLITLFGLIYLYSQWVLLILVVGYLAQGLLARGLAPVFRLFSRKSASTAPG